MNKYAITTLLFGDIKYIPGAAICAYVHKLFIKKYDLKIDVTLMLSKDLIKYKEELEKYYDKIFVIELFETAISHKTNLKRYTQTMKFLPNKVQMYNLTDYEKVLFTDIDFLPITKDFYNIFNLSTPAFYSYEVWCDEFNKVIDKNKFVNLKLSNNNLKNKNYNGLVRYMKKSINATLMLIKPSSEDYNNFIIFKNNAERNGGIVTDYGVDEILILSFVIFMTNDQIHCIPRKYRKATKNIDEDALGLNYFSSLKPWNKFPVLQYQEENIWHILAKQALKKSTIITDIYIDSMITNFSDFIKKCNNQDKISGTNLKILDTEGKQKLFELGNYILSNDFDNKNVQKVKYVVKEVQHLHSYIERKINKNYKYILELME